MTQLLDKMVEAYREEVTCNNCNGFGSFSNRAPISGIGESTISASTSRTCEECVEGVKKEYVRFK